ELLRWYCEEFYPKYNGGRNIELPCPPVPCYYCEELRPDDNKDCPHCHFPRKEGAKCPDCKAEVHAGKGKTYCENCGYPFADGAECLEKLSGTKTLSEQLKLCDEILRKFGKWKAIQERRKQIKAEIEEQRRREEAERKARQEREEVLKNLAPPGNFQAMLEGKSVKLTWEKASPKVEALRIYRCKGRKPTGYEAGLEQVGKDLPCDATEFVDKTVEGGEYYGYVVCPVAYGENGKRSATADICTALPPEAFTVSPDDGQLALSWKSPAANSSIQPESELKRQDWSDWKPLGNESSFLDEKLTNGQKYAYQLRFVYKAGGKTWTSQTVEAIGVPSEAPPIPEVQNLEVERCSADMIKVRWEWPDGIEAVRLVKGPRDVATKPKLSKQDILERGSVLTKAEYEREGCYTWTKFNYTYYLTILSVQKTGAGERFSKEGVGTAILAKPVTISYRVVKKGLLRSKFFLELESDGEGFPNLSYVLTKTKFLAPNGKYEKLGEIKSQSGNQLRIELPKAKQGYIQLMTDVANDPNYNLKRVGEQIQLGK
ncbi:MAG: zinc ribbon domain-containing protein, partial [Victivallales bacterium]|nr:zinc ribbon domain-containing protein [Victivallales bacterium]